MGRVPRSFITDLLQRVNIVECIAARIPLKKTGANFSALCPFHSEKTPSFSVSEKKQFYHCFGCGASGNVLSFLMAYEQLGFLEALNMLADQLGMEVPKLGHQNLEKQKEYETLTTLMNDVARFYEKQLYTHPEALSYLRARGLSKAVIEQYRLGFAPESRDNLARSLGGKAKAHKALITTGMLVEKTGTGKPYDRFRNRIIFPICNTQGETIAFGGRSIDDNIPKYLNSPETPLFQKNKILYGIHQIRSARSTLKSIIVVEGYMDLLSLASQGIFGVVATLGTAITKAHLYQIIRYAPHIIFCFDGDKAGRAAAWRALTLVLPLERHDIRIDFLLLPQDQDPDSFVQKHGKAAFEALCMKATPLPEFFFDQLSTEMDFERLDTRARFAQQAMQYLSSIPEGVFKQLMLQQLAAKLKITVEQLAKPMLQTSSQDRRKSLEPKRHPKQLLRGRLSSLNTIISLLLQAPQLMQGAALEDLFAPFSHHEHFAILSRLITILEENPDISTGSLLEYWRDTEIEDRIAQLASYPHLAPRSSWKEELLGAADKIHRQWVESQITTLLERSQHKSLNSEEKTELQRLIRKKTAFSTEKHWTNE